MQTKAGTSCLAQTPQLSTHIPLTFSHKFKCEVKKTTALYFQKIKKLTIKRIPRTISEEITKQGLLLFKTRNRTKRKICNFRKKDFQFAKQESVRGSIRNLKKKSSTTAKPKKKKQQQQQQQKFVKNRKPHAKPSKHINVDIPVLKTLIDPIQC